MISNGVSARSKLILKSYEVLAGRIAESTFAELCMFCLVIAYLSVLAIKVLSVFS